MRSSIKVRIYEDCITGLKNRMAEGKIDVPITRPIGVAARPMKTQSPAVKEFVKSARRVAIAYRLPQG